MLLSCGDALIDFLPVRSVDGRDAVVPVAGGSCLNIAVGMARLGAPTGFVADPPRRSDVGPALSRLLPELRE